ncbi:MAG: hypothetical protein HKN26_13740, partial [Acidimicrobiales bacterium]|nr:hypothetical protein [Acidimicrobiales bacterium]
MTSSPVVRAVSRLRRMVGKDDVVDPRLPAAYAVGNLTWRSLALARGLVRTRSKVFLGRRVRLQGRAGLTLGPFCTLDDDVVVQAYAERGVSIGANTKLGAGTRVFSTAHPSRLGVGVVIGNRSSLGEWSYVGAAGGVFVGDDVIGGQYVSFHSQNHRYDDLDQPIRTQGTDEAPIHVADDVWIGAKATFLAGAIVGSHSVVAAGAVVAGEFGPN